MPEQNGDLSYNEALARKAESLKQKVSQVERENDFLLRQRHLIEHGEQSLLDSINAYNQLKLNTQQQEIVSSYGESVDATASCQADSLWLQVMEEHGLAPDAIMRIWNNVEEIRKASEGSIAATVNDKAEE